MGQKVNPHGLRVGVNKEWSSSWIAKKKDFAKFLVEDNKIRKFITKEYAQARAYAELFERYQNGVLINPRFIPKDKSRYNYLVSADEKYLTAEQVVAQNDSFMEMYFGRRNMTTADFQKKVTAFFEVNKLDYLISGYENGTRTPTMQNFLDLIEIKAKLILAVENNSEKMK